MEIFSLRNCNNSFIYMYVELQLFTPIKHGMHLCVFSDNHHSCAIIYKICEQQQNNIQLYILRWYWCFFDDLPINKHDFSRKKNDGQT